MIVVKNVEILTVEKDPIIYREYDPPTTHPDYFGSIEQQNIREELVHGKRFRNKDGEDVIIGMTDEAQKALGIPFQAFEDMLTQLEITRRDRDKYYQDLYEYKNHIKTASFWQRLKYLFTGKI